jgi:uracil-DNA glycosylase
MADADEFLRLLERGPSDSRTVFNPWRDHDERDRSPRRDMPAKRRDNMQAYIEARERTARVMLLGEAPSHRGCRFSGIAFCSEVELTHKADLVARRRLELTSADCAVRPMSERSAAILWGEMEHAVVAREVVLWNAFPWHPYGEVTTSNRKPRNREVDEGRDALRALLRCFTRKLQIFAVGKVAEAALGRWEEAECSGYIRHPSMGGEAKFRSQFRELVLPRL